MAKRSIETDNNLHDKIKELWKIWNDGKDEVLNPFRNFDDVLLGYLTCYYQSEEYRVTEAIDYFNAEISLWEIEEY